MSYKQWQALRKEYIGGSDMATVMGLNPYQSKLELFHQKVGVVTSMKPESESTYSGHVLESIVKDHYWSYYDDDNPTPEGIIANADVKRKTRFYINANGIVYDPRFPHIKANVDGFITEGARKKGAHHPETEHVTGDPVGNSTGRRRRIAVGRSRGGGGDARGDRADRASRFRFDVCQKEPIRA